MQEQNKPSQHVYPHEEEFSFRQIISNRKKDIIYLWQSRKKLGIVCLAAALFGVLIAWYWPVSYTSRLSFVVEDNKAGGGSMMSALAGQFGFDLGSLGATSGVLAGDNVQALLKSHKMIKQTLLTPYSGNSSLADRYAESNHLKEKWAKYVGEGKTIQFPVNNKNYTRLQDSLMQVMVKQIIENDLSVSKPDKKLSFFEASTTMKDEKLSLLFCTRLIQQATDFYIRTKTERLRTNVNHLQARVDSLTRLLNRKTYSTLAANNILLDANPAYPTANAGVEVQERDKMVLSTIYSEVVKNLEMSRTMLIQETPTFQVVDEPEFPLKKNRLKYSVSIIMSMLIAGSIFSLYLLAVRNPQ